MKVVVITGGSSGIGLHTARLFSKNGYKVYSISRRMFIEEGVTHIIGDVTDYDSISRAFKEIYEKEGQINILINNAGMGISGSIEDTEIKDAEYIFKVNFFGVFNSSKAIIPYMRKNNGGKIINISSAAAVFAIPFQAFYSSTKAAINLFSAALKTEVAPFNIQVCTFLPGDIKTDFTKNREKNKMDSPFYGDRIVKSLEVMEKDEQGGMSAEYAARVIYKTTKKKRLPLYKTIGLKYKVFLFFNKLLPAGLVNKVVASMYGFIPKKKK